MVLLTSERAWRPGLTGLAPASQYEVTDLDGGAPRNMTGHDLMEQGLVLSIETKPGAAVIFYRKR